MKKRLLEGDGPVHVAYLSLCIPALVLSFLFTTNGLTNTLHIGTVSIPLRLPCLFRLLTGYNCPACGLTRCFVYMSHFRPTEAFTVNHAGILLYMLCVFEIPYRLALLIRGSVRFESFFKGLELALFTAFIATDLFFFFFQFFAHL